MRKIVVVLLTTLLILTSLMITPISADELNCNDWVCTSSDTIFCAHEDCGILWWQQDGTAYQMFIYVRTCTWYDDPTGEPFQQVKREDVHVGCCDYPYA